MDDRDGFRNEPGNEVPIAHVALDEPDVEPRQVVRLPPAQVVEHGHGVPGIGEQRHQVGADEPGAAGHQDAPLRHRQSLGGRLSRGRSLAQRITPRLEAGAGHGWSGSSPEALRRKDRPPVVGRERPGRDDVDRTPRRPRIRS